jgi:outer membrane protein assembly factor BamB
VDNVLWDGEVLLAANQGEVFRLDPLTGGTIWRNKLKGFGRGLVSLATSRFPGNGTGTAASADVAMMRKRSAANSRTVTTAATRSRAR